MEALFKKLSHFHPISAALKEYLITHLKEKKFKKNEVILQERKICDKGSFILKGIVYGHYEIIDDTNINAKPKEVCSKIYKDNDVLISVFSFVMQKPAYESLIALTDVTTLYLSYDEMQYCYKNFSEFNFVIRSLLEIYYAQAELRLFLLRKHNAEQRYKLFLDMHQDVAALLPNHLIASYINMEAETFSRLKSDLFKNKHFNNSNSVSFPMDIFKNKMG